MKVREKCDIPAEISGLLLDLGAKGDTYSFSMTGCAVAIAMQEPERLTFVTKWLYPEVGKRYRKNWKAVERNIRYAIRLIWARAPSVLSGLADHPLYERPNAALFIKILSCYLNTHTDK